MAVVIIEFYMPRVLCFFFWEFLPDMSFETIPIPLPLLYTQVTMIIVEIPLVAFDM